MGVFANALNAAVSNAGSAEISRSHRGVGAWLIDHFRRRALPARRLAVVERVNLAPRQTIALVEADGQRVLVATSQEGTPAFFPLPSGSPRNQPREPHAEGKVI